MLATRFKVGDKVRVRKDLIVDKFYDDVRCNGSMAALGGELLTISCIDGKKYNRADVEKSIKDLEPIE